MDSPHIKSSCGTQNKISNPMGIGLGIDYVTIRNVDWRKIMSHGGKSKMDSPHIKSSCGTQNKISNPMGIGLGIDYVTWRKILKWIPPTSNLHVGHKIKFPILWV